MCQSGRRSPPRCLPPPGTASCPRPVLAPCDHCPTSSTCAYRCLLKMRSLPCSPISLVYASSALSSTHFVHMVYITVFHCCCSCMSLIFSLILTFTSFIANMTVAWLGQSPVSCSFLISAISPESIRLTYELLSMCVWLPACQPTVTAGSCNKSARRTL